MITESLCEVVQHNCNIVDAKHAGNFTLCIYLMKMREYCRWDKGYSYTDQLSKEELGEWVTERELLWDQLDEKMFQPIQIDGVTFDPFDTDAINAALMPQGMVYSGGIGARAVPHFFLGKLDNKQTFDGYQIVTSSEECARDLSSPPAMTLQDKIFIRKESVRRMLWEKVQEWQWHKLENAASRAFSYYDFDKDVNSALDHMTEVESRAIILHELGEIETSEHLGQQWKVLLAGASSSRLDLMLRAVKDFYADALVTLPALIDNENRASLHFYAANMSPLRKQLCPSFFTVYQQWCESSDLSKLSAWVEKSQAHWASVCHQILRKYEDNKLETELEQYIENNLL